jgi:hypothetical protein
MLPYTRSYSLDPNYPLIVRKRVDRLSAFAWGQSETAGPRSTSLRAGSPLRYPGYPVQEIRGSSGPTARRGRRDDKVEGGGPPWHEWRWMDRVKKANLDKSGWE